MCKWQQSRFILFFSLCEGVIVKKCFFRQSPNGTSFLKGQKRNIETQWLQIFVVAVAECVVSKPGEHMVYLTTDLYDRNHGNNTFFHTGELKLFIFLYTFLFWNNKIQQKIMRSNTEAGTNTFWVKKQKKQRGRRLHSPSGGLTQAERTGALSVKGL